MVLAGADPAAIAQQVYFSNPASKMHLLGRALSNLRFQGAISWMHVSEADMLTSGATEQDCEGLVNWALSIHGIEATAFFREIAGNEYRVSLRSKGRIDVARIAKLSAEADTPAPADTTSTAPMRSHPPASSPPSLMHLKSPQRQMATSVISRRM